MTPTTYLTDPERCEMTKYGDAATAIDDARKMFASGQCTPGEVLQVFQVDRDGTETEIAELRLDPDGLTWHERHENDWTWRPCIKTKIAPGTPDRYLVRESNLYYSMHAFDSPEEARAYLDCYRELADPEGRRSLDIRIHDRKTGEDIEEAELAFSRSLPPTDHLSRYILRDAHDHGTVLSAYRTRGEAIDNMDREACDLHYQADRRIELEVIDWLTEEQIASRDITPEPGLE